MPQRRIILHIGVQKTGSTSIQDWLAQRRDALAGRGVHVPRSLETPRRDRKRLVGPRGAAAAAALRAELDALDPAMTTVVISNETLPATLRTPEAVAALKALLDPHAAEYRIIVYLRRQDEQRVSQFSSAMRRGLAERSGPLDLPPYDYDELLGRWAGVFGREAIRPRLFTGDVVADFAAAAGFDGIAPPDDTALRENASIGPAAQAALHRLAAAALAAGIDADGLAQLPAWVRAVHHLNARFAGPGVLPTRAEVAAWLAGCAASNERVRAAWFPDRGALFGDSLSRYPEVAPPPPDPDAVLAAVLAAAAQMLAHAAGGVPAGVAGNGARRRRRKRGT